MCPISYATPGNSSAAKPADKNLSADPRTRLPHYHYLYKKKNDKSMTPQVSVIIPVYNVGKYLEKCLTSVVGQTFADLEIVVVNDGSTDDSPQIIARFARQDPRIVVINKANEGLAYARKSGVEAARGTYIYHLDGDDYLEPDAIELIYAQARETDADMTIAPFVIDYPETGQSQHSLVPGRESYTGLEYFSEIALSRAHWSVFSHLHKRSLYTHVAFCKELSYGEDVYLTAQLTYYASRVVILKSQPLMHYIIRNSSITNSRFSEQKARDILLYPDLVNDFFKDKPEYNLLQKELGAIRIQAYNTLLSKRWFKDAHRLSRESLAILRQYPDLKSIPQIRAFRKLFTLYAHSPILGRLYAQYYICKKKIK